MFTLKKIMLQEKLDTVDTIVNLEKQYTVLLTTNMCDCTVTNTFCIKISYHLDTPRRSDFP